MCLLQCCLACVMLKIMSKILLRFFLKEPFKALRGCENYSWRVEKKNAYFEKSLFCLVYEKGNGEVI